MKDPDRTKEVSGVSDDFQPAEEIRESVSQDAINENTISHARMLERTSVMQRAWQWAFGSPSNKQLRFDFLRRQVLVEASVLRLLPDNESKPKREILDEVHARLMFATEFTEVWHAQSLLVEVTPVDLLHEKIDQASSDDDDIQKKLAHITHRTNVDDAPYVRQQYRTIIDRLAYKRLREEMANTLRRKYFYRLLVSFLIAFALFVFSMIFLISGRLFGLLDSPGVSEPVVGFFRVFTAVISAGLFGASFSLLATDSGQRLSEEFETLEINYRIYTIMMRLAVGTSGALILYFLYNTGIIQSDLFPDISKINFEVLGTEDGGPITIPKSEGSLTGVTVTNKELGKLFIWSFVAGFSERLVPSVLMQVESSMPKAT